VLVYCGRETRYQQPSLIIVSLDEESYFFFFFFFCISFLDQQPTLLHGVSLDERAQVVGDIAHLIIKLHVICSSSPNSPCVLFEFRHWKNIYKNLAGRKISRRWWRWRLLLLLLLRIIGLLHCLCF
jgi:hypothetical protein